LGRKRGRITISPGQKEERRKESVFRHQRGEKNRACLLERGKKALFQRRNRKTRKEEKATFLTIAKEEEVSRSQ